SQQHRGPKHRQRPGPVAAARRLQAVAGPRAEAGRQGQIGLVGPGSSLPDHFVERQVASGRYSNASELVRESLRLLDWSVNRRAYWPQNAPEPRLVKDSVYSTVSLARKSSNALRS